MLPDIYINSNAMLALDLNKSFTFRYHIPRSWLKPTHNLLVIFEEIGGDVSSISIVKRNIVDQ